MHTEFHGFPQLVGDRYLDIFNQAGIGIAHVSVDGIFLHINPQFARIVGYMPDELLGRSFRPLTHPLDLEGNLIEIERLVRGETASFTAEKRYVRKDGRSVWVEITATMVRPETGKAYFVTIVNDIDRRKKAEEDLLTARYELQRRVQQRTTELILEMHERELVQMERDRFFELARDVMAVTDMQGYFRRVNPALCQLLGYGVEELTSTPILSFVHPDDLDRTGIFREALLAGERGLFDVFENRMIAKDGSVKWISWTGRAVPDLQLTYVTGRDITDRKAREIAEQKQQARLTTNSKLHALGLMAANTAHEINNPLTIIYGEGCLLRKMVGQNAIDQSKLRRISDNVVKMSERIVSIVNGLRTLARDGSSDPMEVVPLKRILDDTLPFCRGKISSGNIVLSQEIPNEEIFVCCRPVQLSQALLNLLNNAYDAVVGRAFGAEITVSVRLTSERVEIAVRDNGPGISAQVSERLFEPFVSSKVSGQGMGLGLSISKSMIADNGGELYLDLKAPQTTFVIALPRVL